jgi:hypothetical protein
MNGYAAPSDGFGRQFEDVMDTLEDELRRASHYVDTVIVPQVRRESGSALRVLAVHMERWADRLDPEGMRDGRRDGRQSQ